MVFSYLHRLRTPSDEYRAEIRINNRHDCRVYVSYILWNHLKIWNKSRSCNVQEYIETHYTLQITSQGED